jgi:hypothetical protein
MIRTTWLVLICLNIILIVGVSVAAITPATTISPDAQAMANRIDAVLFTWRMQHAGDNGTLELADAVRAAIPPRRGE